jgi:uncharacterized protein involved in exopolysaccharide biosynthesis
MRRGQDYARLTSSGASRALVPARPDTTHLERYWSLDDDFSLRNYLRIILKWRWTILSLAFIVFVLSVLASFRMTRIYEATARIALGREPVGNLHIGTNNEAEPVSDSALEAETQIHVLSSDTLALAVIRDLQLQSKSAFNRTWQSGTAPAPATDGTEGDDNPRQEATLLREWRRDLEVSKIPRTRMIGVTFRSPDAKLAADIVNTVLREYSEQTFRARYQSTLQATDWLTKQLADLQLKVESSQRALVDYQKANGIIGIDEKQNVTDALNRQLTDAEADRIAKQASYELSLSNDPSALSALQQDTLLQNLRQQEAELQQQLAQMSVQMGPANPRLVEVEQELKQLQVSIASEVQKVASRARGDYQSAMARENLLRAAFERQKLEANELSTKAIRYLDLKRDAESNRNLYESLQQKLKEASDRRGPAEERPHRFGHPGAFAALRSVAGGVDGRRGHPRVAPAGAAAGHAGSPAHAFEEPGARHPASGRPPL